jgi:hypothetical protein
MDLQFKSKSKVKGGGQSVRSTSVVVLLGGRQIRPFRNAFLRKATLRSG